MRCLSPSLANSCNEFHTFLRLNYAYHLLLLLAPASAVVLHLELLFVEIELGEFVVVRNGLDLTLSNGMGTFNLDRNYIVVKMNLVHCKHLSLPWRWTSPTAPGGRRRRNRGRTSSAGGSPSWPSGPEPGRRTPSSSHSNFTLSKSKSGK